MSEATAGWIQRVHLVNFMVYSDFCFEPSPGLNILLAPNGSGKSSIVSAIILGLGGKPELIGRAAKIGEYVKYGTEKSMICIYLNNPDGQHYSIKRKFNNNGSTKWYINNEPSHHKDVCELTKKLNIQVDNLCQILPQDKVEDFAKLNNKQLLESTLMTLGNRSLYEKFIKLKEQRKELAAVKEEMQSLTIMMKEEADRINSSDEIIKSFKKRELMLKKAELCEKKMAWLNYENSLKEHDEFEKKVEQSSAELQLKLSHLDKKEKHLEFIHKEYLAYKAELNSEKAKLKKDWIKFKKARDELKALSEERNKLKEIREKNKMEDIERLLKMSNYISEIEEAKALLDSFDDKEYQVKIDQIDAELEAMNKEGYELRERQTRIKENVVKAHKNHDAAHADLRQFERRKEKISHYIDTFEDLKSVVSWIEANRNKFSGPIYGPLFKEVSVVDKIYAKYVEKAISTQDLISFITESVEDANLLYRNIRTNNGWMINIAHCDPPKGPVLESFRPSVPLQNIKNLGFNHYLIELVKAPPTVLRFLCYFKNMHNIPVAKDVVVDPAKVPDSIRLFFTANKVIDAKISIYSGLKVSVCSFLREGKYLDTAVDPAVIETAKARMESSKAEMDSLNNMSIQTAAQVEDWQRRRNQKRLDKKPFTDKLTSRRELVVKMQRSQDKFTALGDAGKKYSIEDMKHLERMKILERTLKDKLFLVWEHPLTITDLDQFRLKISSIEGVQQVLLDAFNGLKAEYENFKNDLAKQKTAIKEMLKQSSHLKAKNDKILAEAKKLTGGFDKLSPEFKKHFAKAFETLPDNINELAAELYNYQSSAMCLHNPEEKRIMESAIKSKENMAKLEGDIVTCKKNHDRLDGHITSVRVPWLEQINQFIEKMNASFSVFFTSMNCNGFINLEKGVDPEAVENFGLQVQVQFRDDQGYQVLDGHKMSGGERAITTAVYLLSLQNLTSAPFRCVDEINQGMDAENEGRLYKLLFNSVCTENMQYFLLSPKLHKNIEFSERCCLHFITNNRMVEEISSQEQKTRKKKDSNSQERKSDGRSKKRKLN